MALNWDSIDQFRNNRKLDWNAIDEYRTKKSYDPVSSAAKAPTQSQLIVTDRTAKIQSAQNMLSYYQSSLQSIRDQYSTETITRNLDDLWNKYDEWKSLGNTKMADYTLSEIERYNTAVRNRALDIGRERKTENKIKAYEDLIKKYEDDIKFANKVYSTEESVYSRPDFESTSSDTSRKKVPDDYLQDVIDTITGHFNPALLTGGTTLGGGTVNKHFEANQEAQKLSDTQKKTLLYLASKGEWQTAKSYFEALKPLLNELQTQSLITEMTEMPGGEILARAGGVVAAPFAYAEVGLSALTGKDVDMSQGAIGAVRASSEVSAIKSEDRSKAANFFIETGASIAQNLANVLIFGPSALAAMGLQAAGTDAVQQLTSGKTASQAFGHGTLMGTLEVLTEKLPLDNLLDTVNAVGKGLTKNAAIGLLKSAAKQAGIEFAEETINQYAQTLTDIAYYGDDSDYKKYIARLENEGKSHSQAVKEANLKFFVEEPLTSGLQGMTSGFLMGGGAATISEIRTDRFVGDVMKSLPVETVQKLTGQSAEGMSERQLVALANKIGITEDIISLGTAYANASQAAKNVTRARNEYVRTGADNALNAFESAQHTLEASQKEIARINEKLGIDIGGTVNEILDERQERDGSLDTGGKAGTVATVPTEGADAGRTGTGEVVSPETAGTLISSREIGFDNGTDNKTISIVTELNDELKGIADNFSARGYAVVYFTGDMEVAEKGKVFNVRGAVKGNTVYLRYDHPTVSVQQVADHEEFHIIKKTNPKIIKDIAIRILKTHTQAEMESMLQKYARVYGRVYDNIDAIVEEMLADAYAGINAYGATASEYQTEARSVASELTAEPTVRGPPVAEATRKLSPEEEEDIRYSLDSDSVDETDQINMDFGAFFAELAVGDAESQRKISKFRTNTLENITIFDEAERQNESLAKELFGYDSITERESITAAKERLNTDLDGEIEFLTNNTDWSGEDLDTAMGILAYYTREARTTGNYSKVGEWSRLIRSRGTKGGQFIQAFAKYTRTPKGILVKAADTLGDTPKKGNAGSERTGINRNNTTSDQILATMAQFADELELVQDGDIDSLVDVIVKMAKVRNTPVSRTILKRLKGMTDFKYLYDFALRQFENISTDYLKVDFGRKLSIVQTLAQLLNLRTGSTNILSNQLFDPLASFANNVALIPDAIMSIFTHKRMVGFQKSYLSKAKWRGAVDAYRRASVEVSLDVDVSSTKSKYGTSARRTYKRIGNLAERTLSNLEKVMGYELNATDEFLKGSVFAEVMESLSRNVEKGYMTEEEAAEWATQEALYRSFQDDTIIGKILREIKGALNVIGFGDTGDGANKKLKRHTFGVGDLVMKYTQVPGALITRAIEFSPLGYVKAIVALAGAKNNPGFQRGAALAIGRATTGTGLIIAFAALAASGMLKRDDQEDNKDIAAQKSAEGMRGAQLNITGISRWINGEDPEWQPGDVAIDVGNLEPINYIMTIGSLVAQDESNKSFLSKLKDNTIDSLYLAISDLSMMQTISSIANAIKYHDEESDLSLVAEIAIELAQNSVTGFIPSLIRQLAQATDEYYREQYSSRDPWQQLGDKVKSVLPGLRQTLPEKLTPYGEAKTYPNPWLNALNAFMFPGSISIYEPAAVTNELELVRDVTGRVDMFPARNAPYTVRFGGQKYTLTDDERRTYQITRGTLTATLQETIINSRAYREASPDTRADILADAVDYANDLAMREYASNNGIIYTSKTWNKTIEAMQDGADFAAFRKFEADTQGMTKQAEYIEYLSTLNYSDKVMAALYKSVVSDSRAADIDLCMKTGLTFDEYLSAHQKYIELDANKNLTATQKRREFVYWARQFDYEQIAALDEAFSFSFGSKAQEGKYDEFLNQGLSAQNAYDLANKLDDLEPTEGRAGISNSQRYQVIAQSNMSESEKEKALSVLMDEKAYKKYKAARDLDIPTATYIDIITAVGAMSGEDKRDQVYQYLSAHLETYAQKYSMWLALGYAESTFGKYRW